MLVHSPLPLHFKTTRNPKPETRNPEQITLMTRLSSDTVTCPKNPETIFGFLSDFNNFQRLMPDQVTNWQSTSDSCSFTIAGMATLGMRIQEKTPHSSIKVVRDGKAPFDFNLTCTIAPNGTGSDVQLLFDADLNPMLKMMAERPLTNFLNLLAHKMKEI